MRPKEALMSDNISPYLPEAMFGVATASGSAPRAFISPQRYIQGLGVLDRLGEFIGLVGSTNAALLASGRAQEIEGARAERALTSAGVASTFATFGGQCTLDEVDAHVDRLRDSAVDVVVARPWRRQVR
jgi:glycerol dehydrogenase